MAVGDIVLSLRTRDSIDGIGIVTDEYEYDDSYDHYGRKREVNWIATDINENILAMNGNKGLTQRTVYRLNRITLNDLLPIINEHKTKVDEVQEERNHVFIIDEINRGNISKIFGELITLIEKQKRLGMNEQAKVRLPYSKKEFGVPSNVYLLGTMNTADRSIAMLDTALRRRFRFIEMLPDVGALDGIVVNGVNIRRLLETMNKRIEVLYDREHTIGHAYFIELKDSPDLSKLARIFKNAVLPLLQEYFYEDYRKIQLILGDNMKNDDSKFISERKIDQGLFGRADEVDLDILESTYTINAAAFENPEAYRKIYES
ncbi:AAA family ATPase [Halalkalibacter suaedae]|uniref:AAA family ATPase n=1 Tax=Halalkalibacter suaedae TaxID=2822140 RepID=A0A940WTD7_9BACI|nr:AAA family ATPase [Bacillus suaedae]MBP3951946.1 AAA family ATPase [Bacillus suaedae]